MPANISLAVDLISGDHGLRSSIPASLAIPEHQPDLHLHLVDCSAQQLPEFVLGSALVQAVKSGDRPRLALLSNAIEAGKGSDSDRSCEQLERLPFGVNSCFGFREACS